MKKEDIDVDIINSIISNSEFEYNVTYTEEMLLRIFDKEDFDDDPEYKVEVLKFIGFEFEYPCFENYDIEYSYQPVELFFEDGEGNGYVGFGTGAISEGIEIDNFIEIEEYNLNKLKEAYFELERMKNMLNMSDSDVKAMIEAEKLNLI